MLSLLALALIGYPWPLAPMNQQHWVTGTFAEYRSGPPPHFHNGVDIPDAEGIPVYAVEAGEVLWLGSGGNGGIRVGRFAYVHVVPRADLQLGDWVEFGEVVGWLNDYNHVHFKDGGGASSYPTRNALVPPGLEPFVDPYHPGIFLVQFFRDGLGQQLNPQHLSGRVDVVVLAMDTTSLVPAGENNGVYRIGYALYRGDSLVRGPDTVFTFDYLPPNDYVHNVYAPWSNNGEHYYIVTNHLETNGYFDFNALGEGDYRLDLFAFDTQENRAFLSLNLHAEPPDTMAPEAPEPVAATLAPGGYGRLVWHPVDDPCLQNYTVYLRFLDGPWTAWATLDPGDTLFETQNPLPEGWVFGLRLLARDCAGNLSDSSRVLTLRRQSGAPRVLLVDGRERGRQGEMLRQLAGALPTPEVWTAAPGGETGTLDFDLWWYTSAEENARWQPVELGRLDSLLARGSRAVISGSRWTMDLPEESLTRFAVAPGDSLGDTVTVMGVASPFAGLVFTARVLRALAPLSGGSVAFHTSEGATVGVLTSQTLALGFAWESVEPESLRVELAARIAQWAQVPVAEGPDAPSPPRLVLISRGPGRFQVRAPRYPVTVEVWNPAGRRVAQLRVTSATPVSLPSLPAGLYFLRVSRAPATLKVWVLR